MNSKNPLNFLIIHLVIHLLFLLIKPLNKYILLIKLRRHIDLHLTQCKTKEKIQHEVIIIEEELSEFEGLVKLSINNVHKDEINVKLLLNH